MPIPAFRDSSDLPAGIHPATIREVVERFGAGLPQRQLLSTRRQGRTLDRLTHGSLNLRLQVRQRHERDPARGVNQQQGHAVEQEEAAAHFRAQLE